MVYSDFKIAAIKIAKKYEISMSFITEKRIEIYEEDAIKATKFIDEIEALGKGTKVADLRKSNQHICIKGNDITKSKSKYLVDDDYYREIIGEGKLEQATMF